MKKNEFPSTSSSLKRYQVTQWTIGIDPSLLAKFSALLQYVTRFGWKKCLENTPDISSDELGDTSALNIGLTKYQLLTLASP
jgi:hypothetical protein